MDKGIPLFWETLLIFWCLSLRNQPIYPQPFGRSPDAIVICNGVSSPRNALRKRRSWNCRTKHRPLNWTKNGGWMEIRGCFYDDAFFFWCFLKGLLYTPWSSRSRLLVFTNWTSFRHAGFFLVVAELSRWNLSLFLIKIYFSWNSSNPPFGNFRSTLESLLGNLVPKRCMPMQTSPPMVPARLEREVINPDPSLALFFFLWLQGIVVIHLVSPCKMRVSIYIYIYIYC